MAEKDVLVCVQIFAGNILNVSAEMLAEGSRLARKKGGKLYAAVLGKINDDIKKELLISGVSHAFEMEEDICFSDDIFADYFLECIKKVQPDIVLVGTTMEGKSIAALSAAKLKTGLTADCTALSLDDEGNLIQTRPAYGGKIMADIITENRRPQMVTAREGVFEKNYDGNDKVKTDPLEVESIRVETAGAVSVMSESEAENDDPLKDKDIILAIGGGIEREEDVKKFFEHAKKMNAALASSRALVDKGWMPRERQIGLTGSAVAPKLLICVGISGSVQFQAGIKKAGKIIAVNKDRDANIFAACDEFIVSDYRDVFDMD